MATKHRDESDLPATQHEQIKLHETNTNQDPPAPLGSPKAILQAIAEPPHLNPDDIHELERAIAESQHP